MMSVTRTGWTTARHLMLAVAVLALGLSAIPAWIPPASAQQTPAAAEIRQVRLTEKQITGFLGAQKDLVAITAKLEAAGDTIDEKLQKELDEIGRKNGFKDFGDFE